MNETKPGHGRFWLFVVLAAYLGLALAYSLLTPAWEANDEPAHAANIEYIAFNGTLPPLEFSSVFEIPNRPFFRKHIEWFESHQPPLYYWLAAKWQQLLDIPPFNPYPLESGSWKGGDPVGLLLSHDYDEQERSQAIALHQLRLLSILFGLATIIICHGTARLAFGREDLAIAAAAFVAFLPKFNVITSVVTNDGLAVMTSALALLLTVRHLRADAENRAGWRLPLLIGLVCGAATLTKLNTLPDCGMLVVGICLTRVSWKFRLMHVGLFGLGYLAVTGWWFLRNVRINGEILNQGSSIAWLRHSVHHVIAPVGWLDSERFLHFVPRTFARGCWYDGSWNQFYPPQIWSWSLLAAAFICLALFFIHWCLYFTLSDWRINLVLTLTTIGGALAVIIIAKNTLQAEGRTAYVGLTAFATLVTRGAAVVCGQRLRWLGLWLWPVLLLGLNAYVVAQFLIPFRAL